MVEDLFQSGEEEEVAASISANNTMPAVEVPSGTLVAYAH
jgi:hypothetical protein